MSRRSRPQYGPGHGRIQGVVLPGTLTQIGTACLGIHLRSVLRFASGFHPTRPHGKGLSRHHAKLPPRAVAFGSRLPPTGPAGDLHPQSFIHAQRTGGTRHASLVPPRVDSKRREGIESPARRGICSRGGAVTGCRGQGAGADTGRWWWVCGLWRSRRLRYLGTHERPRLRASRGR